MLPGAPAGALGVNCAGGGGSPWPGGHRQLGRACASTRSGDRIRPALDGPTGSGRACRVDGASTTADGQAEEAEKVC